MLASITWSSFSHAVAAPRHLRHIYIYSQKKCLQIKNLLRFCLLRNTKKIISISAVLVSKTEIEKLVVALPFFSKARLHSINLKLLLTRIFFAQFKHATWSSSPIQTRLGLGFVGGLPGPFSLRGIARGGRPAKQAVEAGTRTVAGGLPPG